VIDSKSQKSIVFSADANPANNGPMPAARSRTDDIAENAGGQYRREWIIAAAESHEKLASHEPPGLVLRD
jgi:hypothetical protein